MIKLIGIILSPQVISYLNDYFEKNKKPIITEIKKTMQKKKLVKIKMILLNKIKDVLEYKD